jgi:gamma-glutamyl hydrolase
VGIVSQPLSSDPGLSYIAASYVKFVEMAGGRAVPLKFGDATSEIDTLMDGINGVLWPGGGADITDPTSKYYQFASYIWKKAIEKNDNGIHFPQWGTCLGFEFIHVMASGPNFDILECDYDSEDLPLPLNFTSTDAREEGTLLKTMSDILYHKINTQSITQNEHKCAVPTSAYDNATSKINQFFLVKATNNDRNGKPFVSLVEGKKYPVYGMQAHPEKD